MITYSRGINNSSLVKDENSISKDQNRFKIHERKLPFACRFFLLDNKNF